MPFRQGDRVRIAAPRSEYAGCRGTIADPEPTPEGVVALGHHVAVDGENGRTRPFLAAELVALRPARVAPDPPASARTPQRSEPDQREG